MIISHDYKFIFIKTRKTAGSSIEKCLVDKLQGTDYVFAGMSYEKGLHPVNCSFTNAEHKGATFLRKEYPLEWNSYFKFTVERNSWDKIVSRYYWVKAQKPKKNTNTFDSYIQNCKKDVRKATDFPLYTDDNKIVVDYVMRYENLDNEMKFVCDKIGLNYNHELQTIKLKSHQRAKNKNYQDYFDNKTKDIISTIFSKEIEYFNYKF
jgi:hypothetical protein